MLTASTPAQTSKLFTLLTGLNTSFLDGSFESSPEISAKPISTIIKLCEDKVAIYSESRPNNTPITISQASLSLSSELFSLGLNSIKCTCDWSVKRIVDQTPPILPGKDLLDRVVLDISFAWPNDEFKDPDGEIGIVEKVEWMGSLLRNGDESNPTVSVEVAFEIVDKWVLDYTQENQTQPFPPTHLDFMDDLLWTLLILPNCPPFPLVFQRLFFHLQNSTLHPIVRKF